MTAISKHAASDETTAVEPADQIYNGGEPHTHDGLRAFCAKIEGDCERVARERDELKLRVTRLESDRVDLVAERGELRDVLVGVVSVPEAGLQAGVCRYCGVPDQWEHEDGCAWQAALTAAKESGQ